MARFISYRCPDCGGTFRHLQHPIDAPPPDRCPLCHSWVSADEPPEEVFVPAAPAIRKSAYAKSVEQSYRAQEAASIERSNEAAAQLELAYRAEDRASPIEGDPAIVNELRKHQINELKSGLKITNMRDPTEMRAGDIAAVPAGATEAAARLSNGIARPGFQAMAGGALPNHAPGIGPANAGSAALDTVRTMHRNGAAGMIRAGQLAPAYMPSKR